MPQLTPLAARLLVLITPPLMVTSPLKWLTAFKVNVPPPVLTSAVLCRR